jgi:hypothetical protein
VVFWLLLLFAPASSQLSVGDVSAGFDPMRAVDVGESGEAADRREPPVAR